MIKCGGGGVGCVVVSIIKYKMKEWHFAMIDGMMKSIYVAINELFIDRQCV